jgi:hypothetical protein
MQILLASVFHALWLDLHYKYGTGSPQVYITSTVLAAHRSTLEVRY